MLRKQIASVTSLATTRNLTVFHPGYSVRSVTLAQVIVFLHPTIHPRHIWIAVILAILVPDMRPIPDHLAQFLQSGNLLCFRLCHALD